MNRENISIYKIALVLFVISYLWHFPFYEALDFNQQKESYDFVIRQMVKPFDPHIFDGIQSYSQLAKRAYRFLVPQTLNAFNLDPRAGLVIQHFLGYLFVIQLLVFFKRWTENFKAAIYLTAACCGLFFTNIFTYDTNYHFDGYSLILALFALNSRSRFRKFMLVLPSMFIDERAITTLAILFLCECYLNNRWDFKVLAAYLLPIILSIGVKLLIADITLIGQYNGSSLSNNYSQGIEVAKQIVLKFPMYVAISFEAVFFILILLLHNGLKSKLQDVNFRWLLFSISGYITLLLLCMIVADISRAFAYLFPGVLMILVHFAREYKNENLVDKAGLLALQNFIFPTQYIVGLSAQWVTPFILHPRSVKWFLGQVVELF